MKSKPGPALLALLVLAALGPAIAVAWPASGRLNEILSSLADAVDSGDERESERAADELAALRANVLPRIAEAAECAASGVPEHDSRIDRLLLIESAAAAAGVRIRSAKELPLLRPTLGAHFLAGLEIAADGTFDGLVAFLDALETGPRLVGVERFLCAREGDDAPRLAATLVLRFPVRASVRAPNGSDVGSTAAADDEVEDDADQNADDGDGR